MEAKPVLAIDFGTTNSYFCKSPPTELATSGVMLDRSGEGIATAILYREGKTSLIGERAINTYADALPEERRGYRLRTQFKPDISSSAEAQNFSQDFFEEVRKLALSKHIDFAPLERRVIVGVPCEADDEYRRRLAELATRSEYGTIETVPEPFGALVSHVGNRVLAHRDALRGVLVVDFGGGTCDFTLFDRGKVQHAWGDMELGGRLFADLFFQWFLDQNPTASSSSDSLPFAHLVKCREIKERFSDWMMSDRADSFGPCHVTEDYFLREMSWNEFVHRAENYLPSSFLKDLWAGFGVTMGIANSDQPLDLLAWFREKLLDVFETVDKRNVEYVILAGGSSQWRFVSDVIREVFSLEETRICRSDRPQAVIAEGLAIWPALTHKLRETQSRMAAELPVAYRERLGKLIDEERELVAIDVANLATQVLMDDRVVPLLERFRTEGGSIAGLREQIDQISSETESTIQQRVSERVAVLGSGLAHKLVTETRSWFEASGLVLGQEQLTLRDRPLIGRGMGGVDLPNFFAGVQNTIGVIATTLSAVIGATVCGGAGMALLMSGPLGLVLGAIIGLVASGSILFYGRFRARQMAERLPVPRWVLGRILTDTRILEIRTNTRDQVQDTARQQLKELKEELVEKIEDRIRREIDALGEFNLNFSLQSKPQGR